MGGEALSLLVDVGPANTLNKCTIARAVSSLMNQLVLLPHFNGKRKVGVLLLGSKQTCNRPARMHEGYFTSITNLVPCNFPTQSAIQTVEHELPNSGSATDDGDIMEGIACAVDSLHRVDIPKTTLTRRVLVISPFSARWQCDEKYLQEVFNAFCPSGGTVDVLQLLSPVDASSLATPEGTHCAEQIARLSNGKLLEPATYPLLAVPYARECKRTLPSKISSVALSVNGIHIAQCSQWKRVLPEKLLTEKMKKKTNTRNELHHAAPSKGSNAAVHATQYRTSLKHDGNAPLSIDDRSVAKAFTYGASLVPVPVDLYNNQRLQEEPRFEILGTMPTAAIPRWMIKGDVTEIAPEKGSERYIASLARALHKQQRTAIVAFCFRRKSSVNIGRLLPSLDEPLETLILSPIPFKEDIRYGTLPSFKRFNPSEANNHSQEQSEKLQRKQQEHEEAVQSAEKLIDLLWLPGDRYNTDEQENPVNARITETLAERNRTGSSTAIAPPEPFLPNPWHANSHTDAEADRQAQIIEHARKLVEKCHLDLPHQDEPEKEFVFHEEEDPHQ